MLYGGSARTMSKACSDSRRAKRMASPRCTVTRSLTPRAAILLSNALSDGGFSSTKVAEPAPRDKASRPSAPLPANRSRTRAPSRASPNMLIQASRTRSAVGRTRWSFGISNRRPPNCPATIRITECAVERNVRNAGQLGESFRTSRRASRSMVPHVWRKRAEPRLETAHAVPLVALDAKGRVDRFVAQPGHPVGPLKANGPQASGTVVQSSLEVSVAHHTAAGEAYPADSEHRARVALAARLEIAAEPLEIAGDLAQRDFQIDALLRTEIVGTERLAGHIAKPLAEGIELLPAYGEARRHVVSPVAL